MHSVEMAAWRTGRAHWAKLIVAAKWVTGTNKHVYKQTTVKTVKYVQIQ